MTPTYAVRVTLHPKRLPADVEPDEPPTLVEIETTIKAAVAATVADGFEVGVSAERVDI